MSASQAALPLEGIKVVDLTTVLMGPFATQILGDYGADIIKVESPEGDTVRGIGPYRHADMGAIFLNANRNKRSIVLNLRDAEGKALLHELIAQADVLAYNLRPQVMAQLGLDYAAVAAINPRIIYLGMFGFARAGPYAERPAYDDLIQGIAGIASLMQTAGVGDPRYVPLAIVDRVTGMAAVNALLMALVHRMRTGEGQLVDVTMFETMARLTLSDHLGGATFSPRIGATHYQRLVTPHRRPYQTSDGWICVVVYSDKQWRSFFRAIGREAEFDANPALSDISQRSENIGTLYQMVARALLDKSTDEWMNVLGRADIPASPMLSIDDLLVDPQLQAAGLLREAQHPSEGTIRMVGDGCAGSVTNWCYRLPAPRLGEHSAEILMSLGRTGQQVAALAERGITYLASEIPEPS